MSIQVCVVSERNIDLKNRKHSKSIMISGCLSYPKYYESITPS